MHTHPLQTSNPLPLQTRQRAPPNILEPEQNRHLVAPSPLHLAQAEPHDEMSRTSHSSTEERTLKLSSKRCRCRIVARLLRALAIDIFSFSPSVANRALAPFRFIAGLRKPETNALHEAVIVDKATNRNVASCCRLKSTFIFGIGTNYSDS